MRGAIAIILSFLILLSGCALQQSLVKNIMGEGVIPEAGKIYSMDKKRLEGIGQLDITGPYLAYERLYYDSDTKNHDIEILNTETGELLRVGTEEHKSTNPQATGSYVYWQENTGEGYELWRINLETKEQEQVWEKPDAFKDYAVWEDYVTWRERDEDALFDVFLLNVETETLDVIKPESDVGNEYVRRANPLPTLGEGMLAFLSLQEYYNDTMISVSQIELYDLETEERRAVFPEDRIPPNNFRLEIYNEDKAIIMAQKEHVRERNAGLFLVDLNTGDVKELVDSPDREINFATDGDRVLFLREGIENNLNGIKEVMLFDMESGEERVLERTPLQVFDLAVSGDKVAWYLWGGPERSQLHFTILEEE